MKSILCLLLFAAAVSQISAAKLNVTIFYETLCPDCFSLFRQQIWPAYQDKTIQENVQFELVPFGKARYTESPWSITCQHGPRECLGNVLDACFMARNPENNKQVAMISCTMSEPDPPSAGEKCAKKLGYSYAGVKECSTNKEGIALQIKNGRRTLDFKPKITFIPTIVYNNTFIWRYIYVLGSSSITNLLGYYPVSQFKFPYLIPDNQPQVYNDKDQRESLYNFKGVVLRKLKEKGVYVNEE